MPSRSRRGLLELVGSGTAALVAGCQSDSPTDGSPMTASPTGPSSETAPGTEPSTEKAGEVECAAVLRPEAAWPVPRRSPARDGYVADPEEFETAPTVAWEAEPSVHDDSHAHPSYGLPVVEDSVYLTNELEKGPQRPMYGHVHALAVGSGDRRWTSDRLRSPSHPVVWGDLAVVVAETENLNATVVAFDRADGTRRWTREFEVRDSGFVTAGDHLYLALEEDSDRGTVRTLAEEGSTVWSREGAFADHVTEGPIVGPNAVHVATRDGRLHALARDDGTTLWTHRFQHPAERRPYVTDLVATDCAVVAVVEGAVTALDDGGSLVWGVSGDHGALATDGEKVYVATNLGGGESELRALSAATGDVRWSVKESVEVFQPALVAGDAVYVHVDESVAALDRADGTELWRTDGALGDLALADGTLYGTTRKSLLALR